MCGILGEYSRQSTIDFAAFEARRDLLRHRGPDDAGSWISADASVALGNRRLALQDASAAGHQPMANEDGTVWVTFNGEIYNFRSLRSELVRRGHQFHSHSDTEVLVHGWEEWGESMLSRLEGMYALGLWDSRSRQLVLARDRYGIKPLYYAQAEGNFLFASEPRALVDHPKVNRNLDVGALCDFLIYRFVPSPKCIWRGLRKLPPAHALRFDATTEKVRLWCHWSPSSDAPRSLSEGEVGEALETHLREAVHSHRVADGTVGSFLSGGMDSSAIAWAAAEEGGKAPTFSIGFSGWAESEHRPARAVAETLNRSHRQWILGSESLALLERMAGVYDEPIADISTIPTFAVSSLAAGYVKAALSGEGADELFGGYGWHHEYRKRALEDPNLEVAEFYGEAMAMGAFGTEALKDLLHGDHRATIPDDPLWFYRSSLEGQEFRNGLESLQWLDIRSFMGELVLTKVDRASMAASLEARVPFLDHGLFDFVMSLPSDQVYKRGVQKPLLASLLRGKVPDGIWDRPKQGFVGPDHYYGVEAEHRAILADSRLVRDGIFDTEGMRRLCRSGGPWHLWKVLVLELWYRRWVAS